MGGKRKLSLFPQSGLIRYVSIAGHCCAFVLAGICLVLWADILGFLGANAGAFVFKWSWLLFPVIFVGGLALLIEKRLRKQQAKLVVQDSPNER